MIMRQTQMFVLGLVLGAFLFQESAFSADPYAPKLDRGFKKKHSLIDDLSQRTLLERFNPFHLFDSEIPRRSDIKGVFDIMTAVKSQENRGTCSIFSATALLESMLIKTFGLTKKLDLSEEWLAYLVTHQLQDEGSFGDVNLEAFAEHGAALEKDLPYEPDAWEEETPATNPLLKKRCGHHKGRELKVCQYAHRSGDLQKLSDAELKDPAHKLHDLDFLKARKAARKTKKSYLGDKVGANLEIFKLSDVKKLLAAGTPVILELDFYYGAWNHREALDLGIQRDASAFNRGEVGYPAAGSKDRSESPKSPAGHSILLIGYDDDAVIETKQNMKDGTKQKFEYKGVYYFKNSWGTDGFGTESDLEGSTPGYGSITYKYANEMGSFYQLPIN